MIIATNNKFFKGRRLLIVELTAEQLQSAKQFGDTPWMTYRSLKRLHRILTGASTPTRMKKGLRESISNTSSSQMSVITQRCCHLFVTKSIKASTVGKVLSLAWVSQCVADVSTCGVAAVRARYNLEKPCCSTRYSATEHLPAQIPLQHCERVPSRMYRLRRKKLASA